MSFYDAIRIGASGAGGYEVERSIRGDDDQSSPHRLQRTVQSGGNKNKWTLSVWVKRSQLGNTDYSNSVGADGQAILHAAGAGNRGLIKFRTDDTLAFEQGTDGGYSAGRMYTTAKFRDTASWYHLCFVADYANSTTADRAKIFVNGVRQEVTTIVNFFDGSASDDCIINRDRIHDIGFMEYAQGYTGSSWWFNFFCGYMAEYYFIDNQALDPTSFTETNAATGQLVPKEYEGTFGTTGWYLAFTDNSGVTATTLGKDYSGNGNNWTPNGFSVSAGTGNDSLEDTPTNNFSTINPLAGYSSTFEVPSNGNLDFSLANSEFAFSSFEIPTSGKWYTEVVFTNASSGRLGITNLATKNANKWHGISHMGNAIRVDDSQVQSGITGFGNNNVVGIQVDRDAGTIAFTVDGSASGTAVNISSMSDPENLVFEIGRNSSSGSAPAGSINFGQRAFSHLPAGYKGLCSANLPDPTILLPNKHFDTLLYTGNGTDNTDRTGLNFQPDWVWIKGRSAAKFNSLYDAVRGAGKVIYSAMTNSEGVDTGLKAFLSDGFRNGTNQHANENGTTYVAWNWDAGETDSATYRVVVVSDSGNKYRFRNSANSATFAQSAVTLDLAEGGTYTFDGSDSTMASHPIKLSTTSDGTHGGGSSYNTGVTYELDGSTVTESAYVSGYSSATSRKLIITVAASAPTLYYYCHVHSGMGGQANTNSTLGSSNFDGSNQTTVKANTTSGFSILTWTGTGSVASMGHGLGVAPKVIWIKTRSNSTNWVNYHSALGVSKYMHLSTDGAANSATNYFADDSGNGPSSTVFYGRNDGNTSSQSMVAYCFSEVEGYSKFGSYTGNGSSDGTFVFTGFKPAWLLIKKSSGNSRWQINDIKRNPENVTDALLFAEDDIAESASSSHNMDLLSNGFKHRNTEGELNGNGETFIYLAFAEAPFKNARAR